MQPQDSTTLLIAIVSIVVSGVAVGFAYWQAALTRRGLGAETLLQLNDLWQSDRMLKTRSAAARQLLEVRAGKSVQELYESEQSDVDEVLDYLVTVAFFCQRKVLDRELVFNMFYWPIENYWIACRNYVEYVRRTEDRQTWENLSSLLPKLRKLHPEDAAPNEASLPLFLATEAALIDKRVRSLPPELVAAKKIEHGGCGGSG